MRHRLHQTSGHALRARVNWLLAHPGETLNRREHIHHVNGDTLDDRLENLAKLSGGEHNRAHGTMAEVNRKRGRLPDKPCERCGTPIRPSRRFCSLACKHAVMRGANWPRTGIPRPQAVKDALRRARLGTKASPETRAKMRRSQQARRDRDATTGRWLGYGVH
jgi:hypothetical protein